MKALLRKDLYMMKRTLALYFIVAGCFAVFSGINAAGSVVMVVYTIALPMSAMGHDEKCKWDKLAAMLPYADRDIVLSRYVMCWVYLAFVGLMSLVGLAFLRVGLLAQVLLNLSEGLLITAIMLPLMFRFGPEKGRVIYTVLLIPFSIFVAVLSVFVFSIDIGTVSTIARSVVTQFRWVFLAAAVALNVLSVPLSVRMYRRRQG
jgi:hypothetical protein